MTRQRFLALWPFLCGALVASSFLALINFIPASIWLDVRSVRVFDGRVGQPIVMAVDRTIHFDFRGRWIASIRRLEGGSWVSWCSARGETNYASDLHLPDPLTLRWWTYPDCHPLPAGKYVVRTSWSVQGVSLLPDKEVTVDSNIFEVTP